MNRRAAALLLSYKKALNTSCSPTFRALSLVPYLIHTTEEPTPTSHGTSADMHRHSNTPHRGCKPNIPCCCIGSPSTLQAKTHCRGEAKHPYRMYLCLGRAKHISRSNRSEYCFLHLIRYCLTFRCRRALNDGQTEDAGAVRK